MKWYLAHKQGRPDLEAEHSLIEHLFGLAVLRMYLNLVLLV